MKCFFLSAGHSAAASGTPCLDFGPLLQEICGKPCASPTEPMFKVKKGLRELGFFSLEKKMGEGRPNCTNQSREWVWAELTN